MENDVENSADKEVAGDITIIGFGCQAGSEAAGRKNEY